MTASEDVEYNTSHVDCFYGVCVCVRVRVFFYFKAQKCESPSVMEKKSLMYCT